MGEEAILHLFPHTHSLTRGHHILVLDIQTGVVIAQVGTKKTGDIGFSMNQGPITLIGRSGFFIYGLNGQVLHAGQLPLPNNFLVGAQWAHKGALWFVTRSEIHGQLAIDIQELQPSLDPLYHTVRSFLVPSFGGEFYFSPVSLHASFVTQNEVVIFDVQESRIIFQAKASLSDQTGQFSHDGSFFGCATLDGHICIWKKTPTSYVSWSTLHSRLSFEKFLFSPTATSILTWGPRGIQLLHPENSTSYPSPTEKNSHYHPRRHLVACSSDEAYIVIAQRKGDVVTVLDSVSGAMVQSIPAGVQIQAIGIIDHVIFVAGENRLMSWNLGVGEGVTVGGSHNIAALSAYIDQAGILVISNDYSHIAFGYGVSVVLYDIKAQAILIRKVVGDYTPGILFSQDGHWLYICSCHRVSSHHSTFWLVKCEMGDGCLVNITRECLEGRESWDRFFPSSQRYRVRWSKWVTDSSGSKCLWLPPSWRIGGEHDVELVGRFLALVDRYHQKPFVIELQAQPHLLPVR